MDNYPGTIPPTRDEDRPSQDEQRVSTPDNNATPYYLDNGSPRPYPPNPGPVAGPTYAPPTQNEQPPYAPYGGIPVPPYVQPATTPQPVPDTTRRRGLVTALIMLAAILGIAGFLVGGEPAQFMTIGIQFLPFAVLALLAYSGVKSKQAAVFAYICLFVVEGLMMLNVMADVLIAVINDFGKLQAWETDPYSTSLSGAFRPDAAQIMLWTFVLLVLVFILSVAMLFRPVRVLVARIMPIDPDNFVHKIALSVLTLLLFSSFIPLVVLSWQPPILIAINNPTFNRASGSATGITVRPQDLIYQFVWMIPSTLVAAGWVVARRFPDVLKRLGMVRPTLKQIGTALVLGVVFAFLANYLDWAIHSLFVAMGWATTDTGAFNDLLKGVTNPAGAVLVGVTAGIGEEMAVRGLLQPRFGIIASNLVFTSLHAFQYGVDGLLSVFILGLAFGIIRAKSNTSTSAIVHGTYDFTLVLASALALGY